METTDFNILIKRFFKLIEKDKRFFNYYNLTEEDSIKLANQRALNFLLEVIDDLPLLTQSQNVDFSNVDLENKCFNFKLYPTDITLILQLMYLKYMGKDEATLHANLVNFVPNDLNVFSPANERNSYENMLTNIRDITDVIIDKYNSTDRITGKLKKNDYRGI